MMCKSVEYKTTKTENPLRVNVSRNGDTEASFWGENAERNAERYMRAKVLRWHLDELQLALDKVKAKMDLFIRD